MKTLIIKISLVIVLTLTLSSCLNEVSSGNDFVLDSTALQINRNSTKNHIVHVLATDSNNFPISGVQIKIITQNPLNTDGSYKEEIIKENTVYTGSTQQGGVLSCEISINKSVDSLYVLVSKQQSNDLIKVKLIGKEVNIKIE